MKSPWLNIGDGGEWLRKEKKSSSKKLVTKENEFINSPILWWSLRHKAKLPLDKSAWFDPAINMRHSKTLCMQMVPSISNTSKKIGNIP
jgi:hypothetical protein